MEIQIHSNLTSNSQKAVTLAKNKKFGEYKQGKVIYSKYEALYLVETKKAEFVSKPLKLKADEQNNYFVFRDLRKKGYIVKAGLKFGVEFRVYENLKAKHAKWLVYAAKDSDKINLKDFIAKNRIAHSTGKKILMAVIDSQQDVSYYEVGWVKP